MALVGLLAKLCEEANNLGDSMLEYILCYSTAFFLGMATSFVINIVIAKYVSSN